MQLFKYLVIFVDHIWKTWFLSKIFTYSYISRGKQVYHSATICISKFYIFFPLKKKKKKKVLYILAFEEVNKFIILLWFASLGSLANVRLSDANALVI